MVLARQKSGQMGYPDWVGFFQMNGGIARTLKPTLSADIFANRDLLYNHVTKILPGILAGFR